jgi:hypothetical protein
MMLSLVLAACLGAATRRPRLRHRMSVGQEKRADPGVAIRTACKHSGAARVGGPHAGGARAVKMLRPLLLLAGLAALPGCVAVADVGPAYAYRPPPPVYYAPPPPPPVYYAPRPYYGPRAYGYRPYRGW